MPVSSLLNPTPQSVSKYTHLRLSLICTLHDLLPHGTAQLAHNKALVECLGDANLGANLSIGIHARLLID